MPVCMGLYEKIAPTEQSDQLLKMIGGQKMFGTAMKVSEKIKPELKDKVKGIGSMPSVEKEHK